MIFTFGFKTLETGTIPDTARKILPNGTSYIGKSFFFTKAAYSSHSRTTSCTKSGVIWINDINVSLL